MPLTSSDVVAYACASRPTDDVSTAGGAIDPDTRAQFAQMSADDNLEVQSTSGADLSNIVIIGRGADNVVRQATIALNGTSVVADTTVFSKLFSIAYAIDAIGSISVRRSPAGAIVCVIPSGERGATAMFNGAVSEVAPTVRYDKFFWKNVHGALTLSSAKVKLIADPEALIRQGVALSVDDSLTIANRKTPPSSIVFVDDNVEQDVPAGGTLAAGEAVGVWIELTLAAVQDTVNSTFSSQIAGTS